MNYLVVEIEKLKEIPELRDFYAYQSVDDLFNSYMMFGQKSPIHITPDLGILNGYRMVEAIKRAGDKTVKAIIITDKPDIHLRILLNDYRTKTTTDRINEIRAIFNKFPKRQGQRSSDGKKYERDQIITSSIGNRWKGDVIINKLEYILNNDLEGDILSKGIIEKNWKVDTCYDFLKEKIVIDKEKNYGFTKHLIDGTYEISEVNKFIDQRLKLDSKFNYTFVIPEKANSYNIDCVKLPSLIRNRKLIDLLITSIPYWDLRTYKEDQEMELGQEKTKEEYARHVAEIFSKLVPTLKDSANVIINAAETYRNGVAQGIPFLIRDYIEKFTPLVYKDTLIWSKVNPRPQGENIKRPVNSIEYLFWFVVDPKKSKYNLLTFPVTGKTPKITNGAKDVASNGKRSQKSKSISKTYGKLMSHLKEQEIENIIVTSVGRNHDIFNISEKGHPAPMSPMVPVTLILMLSDETDLVCDPFSGSNVVGKCCLELNRRAITAEVNKEYFDIGCEMLNKGNENFNREGLDSLLTLISPDFHENDLRKAA